MAATASSAIIYSLSSSSRAVPSFHLHSFEVSKNGLPLLYNSRRLSVKVFANAEYRRKSRKKASESKTKNPLSKSKSAAEKTVSDVQTDAHEKDYIKPPQEPDTTTKENLLAQDAVITVEKQGYQGSDANGMMKKANTNDAIKKSFLASSSGAVEKKQGSGLIDKYATVDNKKHDLGKNKKTDSIAVERGGSKSQELQVVSKAQYVHSTEKSSPEGFGKANTVNKDGDKVDRLKTHSLQIEKDDVPEKELRKVAKENAFHSLIFFYPPVAAAGEEIQIFLNKSMSALANESKIFIMGAYNDWRWNSFTVELQKAELSGNWWVCKLCIPKESYKIDFVFFNGGELYENNNRKDFSIPVDGGMDKHTFEDFLLEEKRRELEKAAAEQAKREREALLLRMEEEERMGKEEDRVEAKRQLAEKKLVTHLVYQKAVKLVDNLWFIEPNDFKGGDKIKLYYNRSSRPLAFSSEVWIHGGCNNWVDAVTIVQKLCYDSHENGDWWVTDVVVPDRAFLLNWVFADGPPGNANIYDNNDYEDFHALVSNGFFEELYWVEEEQKIYLKLQKERREKKEAALRKAEKMAQMKAERKEKTMKLFYDSQKHIFYTEPSKIQAGSSVAVFYNPSSTVLNRKDEVWFRCSFNRWTHRLGILAPQKMIPAENGSHLKATVTVPLDAYMMDFVFSERGDQDGGCYDNRNGMDYHVPVVGGVVREPPMHIVHIAVEMAPIAKVGGLGDVVTSLSRAVQDLGHHVEIIVPKYDCLKYNHVHQLEFRMEYSWGGTKIKVWHGSVEGLSVYFIEPDNGMFWVGCIYGRKDDGHRFGFFCHASLEFLRQSGMHPDIIHCHDWSSAPVASLFQENYKHYGLSNASVVFTIHNLEFGAALIGRAMANSDKATTVSYTYAQEISSNPAIAPKRYKLHGIVNGIDPDIWDPFNDPFIPVAYTQENVVEGKRAAKEELQRRLGLKHADRPLVGIITRLTAQKGIHLIKHAIWRTLDRSGQVVLLGSAPDPRIQSDFNNLANDLRNSQSDMARLCLTYDEPLSHLIYAASDFILVPSLFEPCGLTQLIAMRYGAIPVVRKTGGLNDTVFDVDHDRSRAEERGLQPNGFSFEVPDFAGIDYSLNRAISAWYDNRKWFYSLCKQVMEQDWSWNRAALDYMELYYSALK